MSALSIVEHFDVIEDIGTGQFACFVDAFLNPLFLQTAKERFDDGVVPAVTAPAHAGFEVMLSAESEPVVAAVLRPLVGVDDDALFRLASPHGHQDRIEHEFPRQRRFH